MLIKFLILSGIGLLAGILSGMGLGAIILVPALTLILGIDQKTAQGINLLYFIPTAFFSLIIHKKNKNIKTNLSKDLIIWGIIGALPGTFLTNFLDIKSLQKIFAYFLFFIGIYQLYFVFMKDKSNNKKRSL